MLTRLFKINHMKGSISDMNRRLQRRQLSAVLIAVFFVVPGIMFCLHHGSIISLLTNTNSLSRRLLGDHNKNTVRVINRFNLLWKQNRNDVKMHEGGDRIRLVEKKSIHFRYEDKVKVLKSRITLKPTSACPCSKPQFCNPVTGPRINPNGELYGFYSDDKYPNYFDPQDLNFTYITTIAWANNMSDVTCLAHEHNVRVIQASPRINLTELSYNDTALYEWAYDALLLVISQFRDGIVFDYEEPLEVNSVEAATYVKLINITSNLLHQYNTNYQVTTCISWSPDNIDRRGYDYKALYDVSDLVYIMVYDIQSQIYSSACIANANSPYESMKYGIQRYYDMGLQPNKMILGIPWYGYKYPCSNSATMTVHDRYCELSYKPFRNVKCSDAIGREYDYSVIMAEFREATLVRKNNLIVQPSSTTHDKDRQVMEHGNNNVVSSVKTQTGGIQWDDNMESPFFNIEIITTTNIENEGPTDGYSRSSFVDQKLLREEQSVQMCQYWFDNADSLRMKYKWAKEQNMVGIGPFTLNNVNIHDTPEALQDSIDMWSAFDNFF